MRSTILTQNKPITGIAGIALVLIAALAAMQLTGAMNWGWFDFLAAAVLLLGAAAAFQLATRLARSVEHKAILGAAVAAVLVLVWVALAVGLVGTAAAGS